jgi:hypothetical protein
MSSELEVLFSSAARVEVLRLFLLNPGRQFYQREIERETGQPLRAVQREVERLEGIQLLTRSKEGNRVFYGLDSTFPFLSQLAALLQAAAGAPSGGGGYRDRPSLPAEPIAPVQPFSWMDAPPLRTLPRELRRRQVDGEWDQAL